MYFSEYLDPTHAHTMAHIYTTTFVLLPSISVALSRMVGNDLPAAYEMVTEAVNTQPFLQGGEMIP